MTADPEDVRNWLKAIGALAASNVDRREAEERVAAYVPLLVAEFPAGAFTAESLAAVAKRCRFFPAYADLVEYLAEWWSEHRMPLVALPAPDPSVSRREALRESWANADGIRRLQRECDGNGPMLRFLAACVAQHAPQHLPLLDRHLWPEWAAQTVEGQLAEPPA